MMMIMMTMMIMIMMMSGWSVQTRHPRPGQEEGVQTSEGAQCGECDDVCEVNFLTAKVAVQQSTMSVCLSVCLSQKLKFIFKGFPANQSTV